MIRLRRIALVAVVWVTSALTVAAGVPEVVCQCARTKTEAAGKTRNNSICACNCGGQCCAATEANSCCSASEESASAPGSRVSKDPATKEGRPSLCIQTGRCIRTLTTNPTSLADNGKKLAASDSGGNLLASPGTVCVALWGSVKQRSIVLDKRCCRSSSEAIILLQHFNI
jgi:hypothetical protein